MQDGVACAIRVQFENCPKPAATSVCKRSALLSSSIQHTIISLNQAAIRPLPIPPTRHEAVKHLFPQAFNADLEYGSIPTTSFHDACAASGARSIQGTVLTEQQRSLRTLRIVRQNAKGVQLGKGRP